MLSIIPLALILGSIAVILTIFNECQTMNTNTTCGRKSTIIGYHDFPTGKNQAKFNHLCGTKDPYYHSNDVYWWWKYVPFYWQSKYQDCDKYGCGKSSKYQPRYCSHIKHTPYKSRGYGWKDCLFYHNRAEFCKKYPEHINCPISTDGRVFDTLGYA